METKLAQLKGLMAAGQGRKALKLAAGWGKRGLGGGVHAEAITKGWSAASNPAFYLAIGISPEALIEAGLAAIRERYDIRETT